MSRHVLAGKRKPEAGALGGTELPVCGHTARRQLLSYEASCPGHCSRGDCYSASDRGAEYCDERVCVSVCVCLSTTMCSALHVRSLPAFVDV